MNENIIEMRNITIEYFMKKYTLCAVDNVDFDIKRGTITALVGESGSGKTTLANAILQNISSPGKLSNGSVTMHTKDESIRIDELDYHGIKDFRWSKVSMVFQASQNTLNPVMTIFDQFYETAIEHQPHLSKSDVEKRTIEVLKYVKLDYERVLNSYPHELSGGMKQRVMIAFSLLLEPELIILDEPTTALDVITQDYIFKILRRINKELGITMLLMTHDIAIVAKYANYVGVMYNGKLVEYGTTFDVFKKSQHAYTRRLIESTPSLIGDVKDFKIYDELPIDLSRLKPKTK